MASVSAPTPGPPAGSSPGPGDDRPVQAPRRLPDLHALELLVAVAQTGSLGRAAARLGISQPTASSRIDRKSVV